MRSIGVVLAAVSILALAGCGGSLDAAMWDCQLEVQKGNAGKSADAAAERARDIEACMLRHGHPFDAGKPACEHGSADSSCYRQK